MTRTKFIAGNWKMYMTAQSGRDLASAIVRGVGSDTGVRVAVCPPFPYLSVVGEVLKGTPVELGAQNVYPEAEGAYTGEVSPSMLVDSGCRYVIVGHSERRLVLGETDEFIKRKVDRALAAGLSVILCVGETLEERRNGQAEAVFLRQIASVLTGMDSSFVGRLSIAYEPVWAIGTGVIATPPQAQEAHAFIRHQVGNLLGADAADRLVIQYGGSAKPENVASLLSQPDVDGALVGGASLISESFLAIIRAARA
jgi:triosephosphate isomerase